MKPYWKIFTIFLFLNIIHVKVNESKDKNEGATGISCYICSSKNGSDPNCEDPFHPAYSEYAKNCEVPKEDHIGTFPAHFCVKIIGKSATTQESLVIRTCVLENMDSQCGVFKFGGEQLNGCILTCNLDGCNSSSTLLAYTFLISSSLTLSLFFNVL